MAVTKVLEAHHGYDLVQGTGDTALVFVHGWLLSRAYWQPLIQQLQPELTCLSYDLRGFGDSTPGRGDYRLSAYAEDLLALVKTLGLGRVWLVGHSLGGSVALWAAYLAPQRVAGVICLNAGGGVYIEKSFRQFRAAGEQMVRYRSAWLTALPLLPRVFSRLMVQQPLGQRWGQQRLLDFLRADAGAARGVLLASTTEAEVHRLPQIVAGLTQPVHFVAGQQDTIMAPRYVRHLASFHPQFAAGNVTELDTCGHFAMLEQTEPVAKLLRSLLAAAPALPQPASELI